MNNDAKLDAFQSRLLEHGLGFVEAVSNAHRVSYPDHRNTYFQACQMCSYLMFLEGRLYFKPGEHGLTVK
jgi:hypothetical protein